MCPPRPFRCTPHIGRGPRGSSTSRHSGCVHMQSSRPCRHTPPTDGAPHGAPPSAPAGGRTCSPPPVGRRSRRTRKRRGEVQEREENQEDQEDQEEEEEEEEEEERQGRKEDREGRGRMTRGAQFASARLVIRPPFRTAPGSIAFAARCLGGAGRILRYSQLHRVGSFTRLMVIPVWLAARMDFA